MKKFILSIMLLSFTINSFSQGGKAPTLSRDYYLQKSKTNNTIGWILLGGGLLLAGIVGDIISIPVFISSHKNKIRAASVAITNQRILWHQKNNISLVTQPSVTIRIR
jgi:hypothetical protein